MEEAEGEVEMRWKDEKTVRKMHHYIILVLRKTVCVSSSSHSYSQ